MYIFVGLRKTTWQVHVSNSYSYIDKNIDTWKRDRTGEIFPYMIYWKEDWKFGEKEARVWGKGPILYILLYKDPDAEYYEVLASANDPSVLKKIVASRKKGYTIDELKNSSHRIIMTTSNYYSPDYPNGDQPVGKDIINTFGRVIMENEDPRRIFTVKSQACGEYILYDEKGEQYAVCDNWKEVKEELEEAHAELR